MEREEAMGLEMGHGEVLREDRGRYSSMEYGGFCIKHWRITDRPVSGAVYSSSHRSIICDYTNMEVYNHKCRVDAVNG